MLSSPGSFQPWCSLPDDSVKRLVVACAAFALVGLLSGNVLPGIFSVAMNGALIAMLRNDEVYDWSHGPYRG